MAEISKVYKGVPFTDSLTKYLATEHVSLCQFLFFLNIGDIAKHIENSEGLNINLTKSRKPALKKTNVQGGEMKRGKII